MKNPKNNRYFIFGIFCFGIILPATLLGYLGFRSFQYENRLLEKLAEERYATLADSVVQDVQSIVMRPMEALRLRASSKDFRQGNQSQLTLSLLQLKSSFVFDIQGRMMAPYSSIVKEPRLSSMDLDWGPYELEIKRLEKVEFVDKDISSALKGYEDLLTRPMKDDLKAALIKNIASCYRRLKKYQNAEAAYTKLKTRFGDVPDPVGLPIGILSQQLLIKLYGESGEPDKALRAQIALYKDLTVSKWTISSNQKRSIQNELKKSIESAVEKTKKGDLAWSRAKKRQSTIDRSVNEAKRFYQNTWSQIHSRLKDRNWLKEGGILLEENQLILATPLYSLESDIQTGLLVSVLDGQSVKNKIIQALATQSEKTNVQFDWRFSNKKWASLGNQPSIVREIAIVDPSLMIRLIAPASTEQQAFLHRRIWIYGGMIGLSFIVILVGLFVLTQAIRRERENAELKADFVANVSHELKTPLTAISYIGERLKSGRYKSQGQAERFYSLLSDETEHLKGLIEDVLDFSKMMGGKKQYIKEKADLNTIAKGAFERFHTKAQTKGFSVFLALSDKPMMLNVDKRAVGQAILNLLDNALKYSGESREIFVRTEATQNEALVVVEDHGIGISPKDQEKIFEKFYRVGKSLSKDRIDGVGLGLAIVKHIMEGHGGRITMKSQEKNGTTFFLHFPKED